MGAPVPDEHLVKKYPNRRLYDTRESRYIALEDIRRLVMASIPFRVTDAKSGEDITRSILLQVIVEQEESGQPILSTAVLEQLIRFYGDTLQNFMAMYLEKSLEFFVQQQAGFQDQMAQMMRNAPATVLGETAERNLKMWRDMQQSLLDLYRPRRPTPQVDED